MKETISYLQARALAAAAVRPTETESVPLAECAGRVLVNDLFAADNVPPFDKSPYDGYTFRSEDSAEASREHPVTLHILEEIPAGGVPHFEVTPGTAVKILTGAPIPPGADTVVPYERTEFTAETVTIFASSRHNDNVVTAGEDIKKGELLVKGGSVIDAGVMGSLAAQDVSAPVVYRQPEIGIISTGSELTPVGNELAPGKIYDSNGYSLIAILKELGCNPHYYGIVKDDEASIAAALDIALQECDLILTTGGVSVGDYDLTPAAMEVIGAEILFRHVDIKPGMACAYAKKDGKLICGLSGNPAASLSNLFTIALPAIRRLCGIADYEIREFPVTLANGFKKKSPGNRVLRGTLEFDDGTVKLRIPERQGNVVISSLIGCNAAAVIPAGSGPVPAGTVLQGFLIKKI